MDVGRPYIFRINFYTGLFALLTLIAVVMFLLGLVATSIGSGFLSRDEYIVLFTQTMGLTFIFQTALAALMYYGIQVNRAVAYQRRRLTRIEATV